MDEGLKKSRHGGHVGSLLFSGSSTHSISFPGCFFVSRQRVSSSDGETIIPWRNL